MADTFIVFDFETTGLSSAHGERVTEVGAVSIQNGKVVDQFSSLMNAGVTISAFIEAYTGITNQMIQDAPPAHEVMTRFAKFIEGSPLVAHNASFDRKFLDAEFARVGQDRSQDICCSMRVARRVYPHAPNYKLGTLAEYTGVDVDGRRHRALTDAMMTAGLWMKMIEEISGRFGLGHVPMKLMQAIEKIHTKSLHTYMDHRNKDL
jgi:DNA polymerase-3 subunit epsilon